MVLQLRFLVRCGEDDAIDEVFVGVVVVVAAVAVVAVMSSMFVVENEDSTMNSMDYEDAAQISVVAILIRINRIRVKFTLQTVMKK